MTIDVARNISQASHSAVNSLDVRATYTDAVHFAYSDQELALAEGQPGGPAQRAADFTADELAEKDLHGHVHQAIGDTLNTAPLSDADKRALGEPLSQLDPEADLSGHLQDSLNNLATPTLSAALAQVSTLDPADHMVRRVGQAVANVPSVQAGVEGLRNDFITTADVPPPELNIPATGPLTVPMPDLPDISDLPDVPSLDIPDMPDLPEIPDMPTLEVDGTLNTVEIPLEGDAGGALMDGLGKPGTFDEPLLPPDDTPEQIGFIPNPHFTDRQNNRHVQMESRIDDLVPYDVTIVERLSSPFHINVRANSDRHDIAPDELVGTTVLIKLWSEEVEDFVYRHGYITAFSAETIADSHDRADYSLTVEPWIALLRDADDCRILQDLSPKEAIDALLKHHAVKLMHAQYSTQGIQDNDVPRPYYVQHNESAFDYLHRLCHRYHIAYYFDHDDKGHTLQFSDTWVQTPVLPTEPLSLTIRPGTHAENYISDWHHHQHIAAGADATLHKYDPNKPLDRVTATYSDPSDARTKNSRSPDYRYTPHYANMLDGQKRAQTLWEAADARSTRWWGNGNYRHLIVDNCQR
ncbi:phage late control D family protein [bacterium]|nr:phage late control D family protein [bacterium]